MIDWKREIIILLLFASVFDFAILACLGKYLRVSIPVYSPLCCIIAGGYPASCKINFTSAVIYHSICCPAFGDIHMYVSSPNSGTDLFNPKQSMELVPVPRIDSPTPRHRSCIPQ